MFYRKTFYVPIKKRAIIAGDEKQLAPRRHCMFRKSGYVSPENDVISPFLFIMESSVEDLLVKKCRAFHNHYTNTLTWERKRERVGVTQRRNGEGG